MSDTTSNVESVIIQIRTDTETVWSDYSRTTYTQAESFIDREPVGKFRGVDWISGEVVIEPRQPEDSPTLYAAIGQVMEAFNPGESVPVRAIHKLRVAIQGNPGRTGGTGATVAALLNMGGAGRLGSSIPVTLSLTTGPQGGLVSAARLPLTDTDPS